jgi:hypothetical protein
MAQPPLIDQEDRRRLQASLARLDRFANLTDARFRIPGTPIRFGIDPLLGLLPGLGDVLGLLLSLYVLVEAWRLGAPLGLLGRMLANLLIEFVGGIVPVLGDAFDVYWKANTRNTALLRAHIEKRLEPEPAGRSWLQVGILIGVIVLAGYWLFRYLHGQGWLDGLLADGSVQIVELIDPGLLPHEMHECV